MKILRATAVLITLLASSATLANEPVRDATPKEIEAIRAGMERQLLDAQSARFNSVKVKGQHMCGMVNSKNRMGAYAGYRPFTGMIFKDTTGKLLAAPMGVDADEAVARSMCKQQGIPLPP